MFYKNQFSLLVWLAIIQSGFAQTRIEARADSTSPPIPIELIIGNRSAYYQHVMNKRINGGPYSFFNVSSFDSNLDNNQDNHYFITGFLARDLGSGFSVGIGGEIQNPGAFFTTGLQYVYAKSNLLIVLFPSINLNGATEWSQFSLIEYRPIINQNLRLYLRAQFLLTTNLQEIFRSYQLLRAGLEKGNFQFGLAVNLDQFNVTGIYKENYGVFIRHLIF